MIITELFITYRTGPLLAVVSVKQNLASVSLFQKEKVSSSRPPSQQQSSQPQLKRTSSLTDLSHAHEEQEMQFLKLQVAEQRDIIDELTQVRILFKTLRSHANKSITYLFFITVVYF